MKKIVLCLDENLYRRICLCRQEEPLETCLTNLMETAVAADFDILLKGTSEYQGKQIPLEWVYEKFAAIHGATEFCGDRDGIFPNDFHSGKTRTVFLELSSELYTKLRFLRYCERYEQIDREQFSFLPVSSIEELACHELESGLDLEYPEAEMPSLISETIAF